ncbi:MAG: ABC transporter permease, partial [Actinomycetota bacterium]|nr:ABC transporter permease [Actinomycetota bacterium]
MSGIGAVVRLMNVRHLLHRKLRTGLTVSGVAAGVALVFSIAIINATLLSSFRASLRALAGSAELEVAAADQAGIPQAWVDKVRGVTGVERAVPVIRTMTEISGSGEAMRVLVVGVTPEFTTLFPEDLGELGNVEIRGGFGGTRDILLSRTVADAIRARVGDGVALEGPEGSREVEVSGTVSGGALAAFNSGAVAIMTLDGAQDAFAKRERVDSIFVVTDADAPLTEVTAALERATGGGAIVGPPGERGRGLERVFGGLGTLLSMAGTVSLLVALFIVYNTMSMSLAERRKEISMALSLGATRVQVFGAFLAEAFAFGVVATTAGILAGLGLATILVQRAADAYEIFATDVGGPLVVAGSHLLVAAVGGIGVALLGAYLPARKVMSVAPIEALRPDASYEWAPKAAARAGTAVRLTLGLVGLAIATVCFILSGSNPDAE